MTSRAINGPSFCSVARLVGVILSCAMMCLALCPFACDGTIQMDARRAASRAAVMDRDVGCLCSSRDGRRIAARRCRHDEFLRRALCIEQAALAALMHDENPVAHRKDL